MRIMQTATKYQRHLQRGREHLRDCAVPKTSHRTDEECLLLHDTHSMAAMHCQIATERQGAKYLDTGPAVGANKRSAPSRRETNQTACACR